MDEKMDDYGSVGVSSEDGTDSGASESAMEAESVGQGGVRTPPPPENSLILFTNLNPPL